MSAAAAAGPRAPQDWEALAAEGPGPFVTRASYRRPDGAIVSWSSRAHRKLRGSSRGGGVWWRPRERQWWMAVLFAVGSLCFTVGGIASQWTSGHSAIGVVFFAGSLFFTAAAYLQYAEAVNAERELGPRTGRRHWRPVSWEPRRIDWLSTLIQLIGTLFFNVTTFTAMKHGLTTRQSNARVWAPDALGSIAFLVSSELAYAEVCHRWVCLRGRGLSWDIVALNLLGSIAFGVSAVASLLEPSSGLPVSARLANAGTSLGVCASSPARCC